MAAYGDNLVAADNKWRSLPPPYVTSPLSRPSFGGYFFDEPKMDGVLRRSVERAMGI
jgi:hypothetical protein